MTSPRELLETPLHDEHVRLQARMSEFAGWDMPIQYSSGILEEHLATRKRAGIFDVSHMGRFRIGGRDALPFLQHVLSNNAAAIDHEESQYTLIPNAKGGAIDDSYLYRFERDSYLLVVNAANRQGNWIHLRKLAKEFGDVELTDRTSELAMISLQGPASKDILEGILEGGSLPKPMRNSLCTARIAGTEVWIGRTGYTGEPLCFELFFGSDRALAVWNLLREHGAEPVGLGARDTLRLEAGLPLYGHELGTDPYGREIPIFAIKLARWAVSFSPLKGDYVGRDALQKQFDTLAAIMDGDYSDMSALPRRIRPVALAGKGIARAGSKVYKDDHHVGWITSGTIVPYWQHEGEGLSAEFVDESARRAIGLALLDSDLQENDRLQVDIRGKRTEAVIVPYHLASEAPPYTHPITYEHFFAPEKAWRPASEATEDIRILLEKSIENTLWRQRECINLIASEQTPSPMVRLLSIMDPVCRYAEHKPMKAFNDMEVFFYQGTDFIGRVETLLEHELRTYLGCSEVETRLVSGQMANTAVFSALVNYVNRIDPKRESRRLKKVMNNHIIRGGHLSAQPMGALHDFVGRDPRTERAAVVNLPVLADNPYKIDIEACGPLLEEEKPELVILGKSMVLYREPVAAIRAMIADLGLRTTLMYDMAHVLGLVGPHWQDPFAEGADIVTGSTHKTYFGTQRGIVASNYDELDLHYPLWEAVRRRAFPGSVSNHHLGTLLGLLMASYEMNHFRDRYQPKVLANAKALAIALKECGMNVAGDPAISYTETHQVIVDVGYAKGPEMARRLEDNNIIVNYQALPEEEGFTASGGLRLGVSEMTRFGMQEADMQEIAQLVHDVVARGRDVKEQVITLRKRFHELQFCFRGGVHDELVQKLHELV